ncbi:hypothetical protein K488DRAFT_84825 [Vararia minispora EC-137]|uniref:Uncharacterized protein n=1 Tax=Vararia minispora EC-137 TaxID=1314806 RepID=A0ACB8QPI6_9AGAM|nr:hypothetical protein K488DRAFT_84825 [Vararia minispora EC-137]
MSSDRSNSPHSDPIPINGHGRHRSMSYSSSSDGSPSSPPMLQTPVSPTSPFPPKVATSPSTSPILSYFMSASPTGKSNTFPFRRPSDVFGGAPPVFEDDGVEDDQRSANPRRASTAGWPAPSARFPQPGALAQPIPEQTQRGAGIMRRLSLSAGFAKPAGSSPPRPATPPPSANGGPQGPLPGVGGGRVSRRATLLGPPEARPHRAPSPMGERMLKGHFDSFN